MLRKDIQSSMIVVKLLVYRLQRCMEFVKIGVLLLLVNFLALLKFEILNTRGETNRKCWQETSFPTTIIFVSFHVRTKPETFPTYQTTLRSQLCVWKNLRRASDLLTWFCSLDWDSISIIFRKLAFPQKQSSTFYVASIHLSHVSYFPVRTS